MDLTVSELAALVGGQFSFPEGASRRIRGAAAIAEAGEGDVTFFGNKRYLPALKSCAATAALVPLDFSDDIPPVAIRVENPSLAFARLLEKFTPPLIQFSPGVHPTAVIGQNVELGPDVSIQPFAVIEEGAKIGAGTVIGAHAYIGHSARVGAACHFAARVTISERCVVGDRVILHSGVVLGSDGFGFELAGGRHVKIPQIGIVQVDDDVEIGANTTVDRARFGRTWIGEGTKIDNLVQIGHNVVIGKHCLVVAQAGISGSSKLGNYVTVAGQVGIVGHIELGDGAIVAAQSGVTKDVPPKQMVFGSPALPMRDATEQLALVKRLPHLRERVKRLEQARHESEKTF
ncbi:MAG TPA: UDP-3-O-(3-hydroxymyristoyl)glucosamine N-acyltransferase [Chthoniobacteraceae bacterium]